MSTTEAVKVLEENVGQAISDFVAIKNKIIEMGIGVADGTRSSEYAGKIGEVYEAGKKSEYDAFWDVFQRNGTRTSYISGFWGYSFDFDNFYPKYDIRPRGDARQLFYSWSMGNRSGSLKKRLKECGVILDTSQATNLTSGFSNAFFTELPDIDCRQLGAGSTNVFANGWGRLKTIDKLIVNEEVTYKNWFTNTPLDSIRFEGVIGQDLDLSAPASETKLDKASIENIIEHLSDDADGKTLSLSEAAVKKAFEDTSEWDALIATKSDWNISLI